MAYKFQVGPAQLSGSTVFEDAVSAASVTSVGASSAATLSASAGISGGSLDIAGNADIDGELDVGGLFKMADVTSGYLLVADDTSYVEVPLSGDATLASSGALTIENLAVTNAKLAADAVDGTKLADDSVDSEHIVDGSIDLAHMSANSVDSDQYVDGSIDTAHIADAQVTLAKMAANSVDSDQYVDGSIDTAHIADAQVTEAKLATSVAGLGLSGGGGSALALNLNELTAEVLASGDFLAFVDSTDNGTHKETIDDLAVFMAGPGLASQSGSIGVTTDGATLEVDSDTVQVKDLGITTAKLQNDAVTLAKMAANSVDSDQYVDGSIDLIHMSANSVDSDQYVDGSIDLVHMSANSVDSDQYVDGSIDTAHIADAQVTEAKLATSVAGDGLSGGGGSALALDLNELTAASVDVSADSIAIVDADASNGSRKESIADLVSAMAGAGLTATNGVLDANPTVASASAAGTLSADVTFVSLGSAGDMTLPTAAEGKKLTVKRVGGAGIVSVVAGTGDSIGDGIIALDTIGAAVTLVAQSDSTWWII
jgi:trimeric autotransporter adhesin